MRILAIETSCDETAIAILKAEGGLPASDRAGRQAGFEEPNFTILADNLYSQASKHAEFGGVYPNLAKREHGLNLVPLLKKTLEEAKLPRDESQKTKTKISGEIEKLLERNPELLEQFVEHLPAMEVPNIDIITVTEGPGLEPALWAGINFAKALGVLWGKPVVGTNHMEGHIYSVLTDGVGSETKNLESRKIEFPALALLISGGHTELVEVENLRKYKILGQTRDDAVGEAYDKSARLIGLPYPGGPHISRLADEARTSPLPDTKYDIQTTKLPRPMANSGDLDFSFSGLKTAVLYYVRKNEPLDEDHKRALAMELDDAIADVLTSKTRKALALREFKTLIVAGGVIGSPHLRRSFEKLAEEEGVKISIPERSLVTDNAVMIGIAGYFKYLSEGASQEINAQGNLRLDK
jgi:N6-L-threonylcarbamoyladenine synthase